MGRWHRRDGDRRCVLVAFSEKKEAFPKAESREGFRRHPVGQRHQYQGRGMTKQRQKARDTALAVQSGRDTHVQVGFTLEDALQILTELGQQQVEAYTAAAEKAVAERLDDFAMRLVKVFTDQRIADIQAFQDPDFQYLLTRAQHAYARSGDGQVADVLIDIIAARSKQTKRDRLSLVLNAAVEIAPTLTANEFAELSLSFLVKYTVQRGFISVDDFRQNFETNLAPLLPDISTAFSSYQYLESQRCAKIEGAGRYRIEQMFREYCGLFSKGFTLEKLKDHMPDGKKDILDDSSLLMTCTHDSTKLQLRALNHEQALELLKEFDLIEAERTNIANLFESTCMSLEEISRGLASTIEGLDTLIDLWNNTALCRLSLTSIGIAIGHSNLRQLCGFDADLSIWIN